VSNNVTFNGEITDTNSDGIFLDGNSGGTIAFNEQVTTTTNAGGNGVTIEDGSDTIIYAFTDVDITTTTGTGFSVTDGGTITVIPTAGQTNTITTTSGQALVLDGDGALGPLTIGAGGVNFDTVTVTAGDDATGSILLRDLAGTGPVRVGPATGATSGGTITTTGDGVVIDNANNVALNNLTINKAESGLADPGQAILLVDQDAITDTVSVRGVTINATGDARGVVVGSATAGQENTEGTATFAELTVNSEDGDGVVVLENEGGTYIFNDLTAMSTGAGDAVVVQNNSADTIVTFNDMDLDATGTGAGFTAMNGGEIAVTGETTVDTVSGPAVVLNNVTVGTAGAQFDDVNVDAATTNGVRLTNVTGTGLVTIGSGTNPGDGGTITSTGDAILIDNANNVAITRMTVANGATAGNGLVIQNQDGGNVAVNGLTTTTSTGAGIVAQNNTGGVAVYTSSDVDVTGAGDGVRLTNNTGATNTFNGLDVDVTSGTGFLASGGGTVSATGTNTVSTTTGVGVNMNGVEIGAGGFNLNSVNVSNGATSGVILTDLTGGQFRQGAAAATGTAGAGGTLNTAGDAIVLTGVTNAMFNDVTVNSTNGSAAVVTHTQSVQSTFVFDNLTFDGGATSQNGVELFDNGTGELDFTLRNSNINTVDGDDIAFLFTAGANGGEVDVRIQNNTLETDGAIALSAVVATGNGNIQFLVTNNTVTNNSAANGAMEITTSAGRTVNATVGGDPGSGNTFTNNNATGIGFIAESSGAASRINLDLRDNTSNAGNAVDYELGVTGTADFGVVDRDDTFNDANNTGNVEPAPGNVVGDFDDIASVPQVD
jgi:hypothetical protein